MPRQARAKSDSEIYHIMIKGINKEQIFKKEVHKIKIIETIKGMKEEIKFDIIAYCIMDNHMHLLMKVGNLELTTLMKKLNVKYAMYYNGLEKRNGHVFQDRFRSEAVEDDSYMLGALRYIHNNPVKARMSNSILEYKWSSAQDYIGSNTGIISDKYLYEILDLFKNQDEFIKFHDINDNNIYIDTKEEVDENIQNVVNNIIEQYANENQITDQKQFTQEQKEELAGRLLNVKAITFREIAELCNLTVYKVSEIKKLKNT